MPPLLVIGIRRAGLKFPPAIWKQRAANPCRWAAILYARPSPAILTKSPQQVLVFEDFGMSFAYF
jgi:hypothetical protein